MRIYLGVANDKVIAPIVELFADCEVVRVGYAGERARHNHDWPEPAQAWPWYDAIDAALSTHPSGHSALITSSFISLAKHLPVSNAKILQR